MADKIYIRGGLAADRPTLASRELGLDADTKQVWIGTPSGNEMIHAPYDKTSSFRAYSTAAQAINASTNTKVLFPAESYDNLGEYNTADSTFTAKAAGIYNIIAAVGVATAVAGNRLVLFVNVNGSKHSTICNRQTGGTADETATGSVQIKLNANDVVEVYLFSTNAYNTGSGSSDCYLSITRIA